MSYNFFASSNINFGKDAIATLPDILKELKVKKVMVVCDKMIMEVGIGTKVIEEAEKADVEITVYDGVIPNPTNQIVEEAAAIAKEAGIEAFIAVGGGSSMDTAKAVNVLMTNPGTIGEYGGIGMVKEEVFPLIAVPTTAGTSSEITNVSALIDTEKVIKYVVIDNKITPTHVISDPEFTLSVPASVTAATGMDAITHAVESYISNMATPLSKYHSLEALKIFHKALPVAVADGRNFEAREQMMLGCTIVGYGFSNANLGMVHAIAHTLSAHFGLAHGMANACVLPYVIRYNAESCPQQMVEMAEAIGLETTGNTDTDKYLLADELLRMIKLLGVKTISEQGITEDALDRLAEDALHEPVLNFNPRQGVTKEDILDILKKAF